MPQPCVRCGYAVSTILSIDISQNEVFDGVADISTVLVGTKYQGHKSREYQRGGLCRDSLIDTEQFGPGRSRCIKSVHFGQLAPNRRKLSGD